MGVSSKWRIVSGKREPWWEPDEGGDVTPLSVPVVG